MQRKVEEMQLAREQKKREMVRSTKEVFGGKRKSPLKYVELERKFQEEVLMPELEEQKKKLQLIRDFHKPIDRRDIDKHSRKFEKINRRAEEERQVQAERVKNQFKIAELEIGKLKSNILEQVVQRDILAKTLEDEKALEGRNHRKKI